MDLVEDLVKMTLDLVEDLVEVMMDLEGGLQKVTLDLLVDWVGLYKDSSRDSAAKACKTPATDTSRHHTSQRSHAINTLGHFHLHIHSQVQCNFQSLQNIHVHL